MDSAFTIEKGIDPMESGSFDVKVTLRLPGSGRQRAVMLADVTITIGGARMGINGVRICRRAQDNCWACLAPVVGAPREKVRAVDLPRDAWLAIARAVDAEMDSLLAEAQASSEAGPVAA